MTDGASGNADALKTAMDRAGLDAATQLDVIAWLGEQLADERYAQLDRAGHEPKDRIPLARVLIDLPISRSPVEGRDHLRSAKKVLAALCEGDPQLFEALPEPTQGYVTGREGGRGDASHPDTRTTVGIVLIGGPGQGKSTITQSLSAVHHAALLQPHTELLEPAARDALDSIQAARQSATHEWQQRPQFPGVERPRLPLRIDLPDAAAWLLAPKDDAPLHAPALLRFFAKRAARKPILAETLIALTAHIDWLLILDGLDEVPASEARARVICEARSLVESLDVRRPGGLIVATTRPQGYGGELAPWRELQTWHLMQLSTEEARQYAGQLVAACYETKRGERILARLSETARTGATARLLRTPLQVTILVALIARIGRAPGERWSLFSEYYRIIYEREMERNHPAAELLRRYRSLIDRVHAHVGLLLQAETEQAAGTDTTMTIARLRDVMHAVFADQGMDAVRRQPVVEGLLSAITERLVLLVERREGHVGFEIRPLQELMAAWALAHKEMMSEVRILRVARSEAFREVVLFLASKAFAELSDVRDMLVDRVLPSLNDDPDEPMSPAVLRGSVLAIDILEDGAALSQPNYVKKLAALGVRLLDLPVSPLITRLARACMADVDGAAAALPTLMIGIRGKLDALDAPEERAAAWGLLIALIDEGSDEARLLANERWADDDVPARRLRTLVFMAQLGRSRWLTRKILTDFQRFNPVELSRLKDDLAYAHPKVLPALRFIYGKGRRIGVDITNESGDYLFTAQWTPLSSSHGDGIATIAEVKEHAGHWGLAATIAHFVREPTASTLADALEWISANGFETVRELRVQELPWPLAACLTASETGEELRALSRHARDRRLGDTAEWMALETRCAQARRIRITELVDWSATGWPGGNLGGTMLPLMAASFHLSLAYGGRTHANHETIVDLLARQRTLGLPQLAVRTLAQLTNDLISGMADSGKHVALRADDVRHLWSASKSFPLEAVAPAVSPATEWLNLLEELGKSQQLVVRYDANSGRMAALSDFVARGFQEEPHRAGLLWVLASLAAVAPIRPIDPTQLRLERFTDPREQNAALLVRVALDKVSEAEAEAAGAHFVAAATDQFFPAGILCEIALRRNQSPAVQRALFQGILGALPPRRWDFRTLIIHAARDLLGKTPSGLDDPAVWDALQLPMPRPERRSTSDRAPASPTERRPVLIDEIVLRNFRGIEELRIAPAPPQNGHGQWIVLLGKNGLGKTTVLRGLALALFDIEEPVRRPLPPTAYKSTWRRIGSPEEQPSFVRVKLRGDEHGAEIRPRADLLSPEQLAPIARPPNEMIFAYGVRRRYLVSDVKRAVVPELYALVPSLFEEGADLLPLEESLLPLEAAWHNQPESVEGRLHVELRAALAKLLRVDAIELRGQEMWVRGPSIGDVPLKELSDGYLTLAAWVVDLVVRWWYQAKRWKIEPPGPVLHSMTGLVLIDELDLFLHPDWQRSVVRTLKELLPRMSFVVTTHNPLAILGARAAEIWILRRDEGGAIHAEQRQQEPFQLTGSDLYDFYFGIESALPDELGQMLHRYRQVAGDPFRSPAEDAEARNLLARLRTEQLDPGWEPVPLEEVPPPPEDIS